MANKIFYKKFIKLITQISITFCLSIVLSNSIGAPKENDNKNYKITDYKLIQTANGTAIVFNEPYKIEKIKISPNHPGIWGLSRYINSAFVKTKKNNTIANLREEENDVYLYAEINDDSTDFIELIPLFYSEIYTHPTWRVDIFGIPTWKVEFERNIQNLSRTIISFQNKNNCFCCHRLFTISTYAGICKTKGLNIPEKEIKEIFEYANKFQIKDGSYSVKNAYVNFGTLSPTLIAIISIILSDITSFSSEFDMSLYKACLFLYSEFLKKYDSKIKFRLDFSILPIFDSKVVGSILYTCCDKVNKLFKTKGLLDAFPNFSFIISKYYLHEKQDLIDKDILQFFPYIDLDGSKFVEEFNLYKSFFNKLFILYDLEDYFDYTKLWLCRCLENFVNKYKRFQIQDELSEAWRNIEILLKN